MREFVRGAAWWSRDGRPLRADPADHDRLPGDTWARAQVPAGVRLEFVARGVSAVEIAYAASPPSNADAYRTTAPVFTLVTAEGTAHDTPAAPGAHTARAELPSPDGDFTVHLPETLRPSPRALRPVGGGTLRPAPPKPRWLAYGDSITEGWTASRPHLAWPALAGRALGLDTVNLGYAGAARGELASAQHLASLEASFITLAFGTNCWSRTPSSASHLYETTRAFLALVRTGHPRTPLLIVSPVLRPDAESTPNALGATLAGLRTAQEEAVRDTITSGDAHLSLLPGASLLKPHHLADTVHPDDEGHALLAAAGRPPGAPEGRRAVVQGRGNCATGPHRPAAESPPRPAAGSAPDRER